ncbi:hypothetical protein [Saccharophagus degradans]|nr:hypothetical protein [Saccharophagus degradans]
MSEKYWQYRTCKNCGFEEQRENEKLVAAFESTRKWESMCPNCGVKNVERAGWAIPDLDSELLRVWGKDESLQFDQQDEDILLAEEDNIELLLNGVDSKELLHSKRSTLLAALCVLVYDHTPEGDEEDPDVKPEISAKVTAELKDRMHLFNELDTVYISEYIKEVVYPRLGIPLANM